MMIQKIFAALNERLGVAEGPSKNTHRVSSFYTMWPPAQWSVTIHSIHRWRTRCCVRSITAYKIYSGAYAHGIKAGLLSMK